MKEELIRDIAILTVMENVGRYSTQQIERLVKVLTYEQMIRKMEEEL